MVTQSSSPSRHIRTNCRASIWRSGIKGARHLRLPFDGSSRVCATRFRVAPSRRAFATVGTALSGPPKIDAAHDDAGGGALESPRQKFARRARLDAVAQSHELFLALIGRRPRHV